MHASNDSKTRQRRYFLTVSTIVELASDELDEVATLALQAVDGRADDAAHEILVRAYDVACDAGHEYLAELVDLAMGLLEAPLRA